MCYLLACFNKGGEGVLVFSSSVEIRTFTLRSNHMRRVQRKQKRVTGVAFDGQYVYWSSLEDNEEKIMRSREDGSKKEDFVTAGIGKPEELAWDWVTKKLYFTDGSEKHVAVCSGDGHICAILVNTVTDMPRGIALAPQDG
jgi:low density lipoprotein receptor-related protein 5/6